MGHKNKVILFLVREAKKQPDGSGTERPAEKNEKIADIM